MIKKENSRVFMDVSIDGDPVKRMVFKVPSVLGCLFTVYATTFAMLNLMIIPPHSFYTMLLP